MPNPDLKYTDRLQMLLVVGIVLGGIGALIASYQLALEADAVNGPLLLLGTALTVVFSFVALIGAVGIGVKLGHLAAAGQARADAQQLDSTD